MKVLDILKELNLYKGRKHKYLDREKRSQNLPINTSTFVVNLNGGSYESELSGSISQLGQEILVGKKEESTNAKDRTL